MPEVLSRIENVRDTRLKSPRPTTNQLADTPSLFGEIRQPSRPYLAIPKTSSENRKYIPIAMLNAAVIASTELFTIPDASQFDFGVVSSTMHMSWVRTVGGRLKSDYRYSVNLIYNNFPWPQLMTEKQRKDVEAAAKAVLDARLLYPNSTLADLYDPLSMPAELTKAHNKLDRAVEKCYRSKPFPSDRSRVEYLFELYEQLTKPLIVEPKRSKG